MLLVATYGSPSPNLIWWLGIYIIFPTSFNVWLLYRALSASESLLISTPGISVLLVKDSRPLQCLFAFRSLILNGWDSKGMVVQSVLSLPRALTPIVRLWVCCFMLSIGTWDVAAYRWNSLRMLFSAGYDCWSNRSLFALPFPAEAINGGGNQQTQGLPVSFSAGVGNRRCWIPICSS